MMAFGLCSRCGKGSYEQLNTHGYCWECNYSPENDVSLATWRELEYRNSKISARRGQTEDRLYSGLFQNLVEKENGRI